MASSDSDESLLGQGAYGRVERVQWEGQWYARKTMLADDESEGLNYASLRECDIYSRFCSPFMVSVYRMEIENHRLHVWMGLADCSLAQYLEGPDGRSFATRLKLLGPLLWSGLNLLRHLHTYGVLHRDIKPDNILLKRDGRDQVHVYVSDMGSCRWFARGMRLTPKMGTKCFRPPEMEDQVYGKASDVYGLGVTAIHVLHGLHPVDGFNPHTVPCQWQSTLLTYKRHIPAPLFDLLERMIFTRPSSRISTSDALAHDFFQGASIPAVPKMLAVPHPGAYWSRIHSTSEERRGWVEHIITLGETYHFDTVSIVHAVHLYDDFWAQCDAAVARQRAAFELAASSAIWVSGKFFEEYVMPEAELLAFSQGRITADQLRRAEEDLVTTLGFRLVRRLPPKALGSHAPSSALRAVLGAPEYALGLPGVPLRQPSVRQAKLKPGLHSGTSLRHATDQCAAAFARWHLTDERPRLPSQ